MRLRFELAGIFLIFVCCNSSIAADHLQNPLENSPSETAKVNEKVLPIFPEQALIIAEQLDVVKALYGLREGFLSNCIEKNVMKPCDSEWVTCIDDAWVVKFIVGEKCPIKHDGRLNINVLIDGNTGQVISQYPEVDYFKDRSFCRDQSDCIQADSKDVHIPASDQGCYNFIYAQSQFLIIQKEDLSNLTLSPEAITAQFKEQSKNCACQDQQCIDKLSK